MYTIETEINRAIDKSKPVKETCVNIPSVPLEFISKVDRIKLPSLLLPSTST